MTARRAVVFGAAGQLGSELAAELRRRGYEVQGFRRGDVDVTDAARTEQVLSEFDPKLVFNASAYNQVDVAEKEPQAALAVNGLAVRNLALACRQIDAHLIHFSTDYVFDGTSSRPYTEEDRPHPLSAYAVSKLTGELYARAYEERSLIVRTSGVFGPGALRTVRGNFIELMLRLASSRRPIRVVQDHVASPTFAPALAARSLDLAEAGQAGVFHIGGGTAISWFDYAKLIFDLAMPGELPGLEPTNAFTYRTPARRPKYSALSNAKMEALGLAPMPPLREAVARYMELRSDILRRESLPA